MILAIFFTTHAVVPLILAAIAAGYSIYNGEQNKKKEKDLEAQADVNLKNRPQYEIPQGEYDNLALRKSMAAQGLDDASNQLYTSNAQRGLTLTIDSILKGGGSVNNASSIYQAYADALKPLAVANAQAKLSNINAYTAQQTQMSNLEDKQWAINKYQPWADKQQYLTSKSYALGVQGQQQEAAGVNTALSALGKADAQGAKNYDTLKISDPDAAKKTMRGYFDPQNWNDDSSNGKTAFGNNGSDGYYGVDISKLSPQDQSLFNNLLSQSGNYNG